MNTLVKNFYKLLLALSGVAMVASFGIILLGVAARQFLWTFLAWTPMQATP